MNRCRPFYPLLVSSGLPVREEAMLAEHLAACEECRESVALLRLVPIESAGHDGVTLAPGTRVASVLVEGEIGRGGSSVVYRARNAVTRQPVALKVLDRRRLEAPGVVERFARDAKLVARLRGEHICRVNTFGHLPSGEPFIILELLEGEDLQAPLDRGERLDEATAIDHVLQACTGLAEAHAHGIVHRDIKPANLFRTARPDGSPLIKVLDFGIAKPPPEMNTENLTMTGAQLGSLPYMSPEQLRSSRKVDARTDIWSLGATLHHLVSGHLPFGDAGSPVDIALRIWTESPAALDGVSRELASVVAQCLANAPADRPPDVVVLARSLAPIGGTAARGHLERIERIASLGREVTA
jgi:serine/threonine-protein kinase